MDNKIQSALDAAGTAADYSARATYQRGYDAGVASLASERDEAMRGLDAAIARAEKADEDLRCFLRGEPSASSMISGLLSRVTAAEARADAAEARAEVAIARACEAVEAREWALGVQVVAQAARLKLADRVSEAAHLVADDDCSAHLKLLNMALAAWDAVPGDNKETT